MDTIETVRNTAALEAIRSVLQTHVLFNVLPALGGWLHALVLVLFAAMRERIAIADVPRSFQGAAIGMITAGLMSLAFMGFTGLIKL